MRFHVAASPASVARPRRLSRCLFVVFWLLWAWPVAAQIAREGLADVAVDGWGVNIHFTDPIPGEIARFGAAGYRLARMDLFWNRVETTRGVYDFSAYDRLVAALASVNARPLFILDYGNDLYQQGAPTTPEARAAFARFAGAAAAHFRDKGVRWEIWNEPNLAGFWPPRPSADDYATLAVAAARAIRQADPHATVMAPGVSGFDWAFLETVFRRGLLGEMDAVSVHPYRGQAPETVGDDWARLRVLIARYAPASKRDLPMVSSEWGYSTVENGVSEEQQARYLARMWLANRAAGVPISIFYDWRDDGDDPKNNEHRFGTVRRDLEPKPAFLAAQRLIHGLDGYVFRHRLRSGRPEDWRLLFQRGSNLMVVTWTTDEKAPARDQMPTLLPITPGTRGHATLLRAASVRYAAGTLAASGDAPASLTITVTNPETTAAVVQVSVGPNVRSVTTKPGQEQRMVLPVAAPARRDAPTVPIPVRVRWNGEVVADLPSLALRRTDPLVLTAAPSGGTLRAVVENPARTPFTGTLVLIRAGKTGTAPIQIPAGEERVEAALPSPGEERHALELLDERGALAARNEPRRYVSLAGFPDEPSDDAAGYRQVRFVENAAQPPTPLTVTATPPGSPAPAALAFRYDFDAGWRYAEVAPPPSAAKIPENVRALTLWIRPDHSGDALRARFRDSTGQTFQTDLGRLDGTDWRPITIPLDGSGPGAHWGGANDGVIHPPLAWDGLILVDSVSRQAHRGEVLLAAPAYVLAGD